MQSQLQKLQNEIKQLQQTHSITETEQNNFIKTLKTELEAAVQEKNDFLKSNEEDINHIKSDFNSSEAKLNMEIGSLNVRFSYC